ncbi:protein chibby homolog 1-like [Polypterus senegalus]|uniref:protein chibby homolog 1-like n=1 Tax=Polypterus senegalus TaxID=55291 RepID=UPI0019625E68|nr:protein chibby homolog 1-like [Polypterus senegalus]
MPLLGSIFSLKKFSPRKSASLSNIPMLERSVKKTELGLEYGAPFINIGGHVLKFEDGQWVADSEGKGMQVEMQRLKQRSQKLEEENNFLKLKVDILLDMLSEMTADSQLMQKELQEIRTRERRRK